MVKVVCLVFVSCCASFSLLSFMGGVLSVSLFLFALSCQTTLGGLVGHTFVQDSTSSSLMLLSIWVIFMAMGASTLTLKISLPFFLGLSSLLCTSLVLAFSLKPLLLFYVMFEVSLIPIFFIILGWGYQPERAQAGLYMLLYTIFASLPFLVGLLSSQNFSLLCWSSSLENSNEKVGSLFLTVFILAFFVKLPMFYTHVWLPKAHVEAPVGGSMILAGILLKLGGYGLIRVLPFLQSSMLGASWFWSGFTLTGGGLIALFCFCQVDMKSLIAYTSVSHMSLVMGGLLSLSSWGVKGALILMIGHGLSSSGLFSGAGILYNRSQTRSTFVSKGVGFYMPSFSLAWFILCASNMAAPPSLNLLGELSLFLSIINFSWPAFLPLGLMGVSAAVYSLYLYVVSQHGAMGGGGGALSPLSPMELLNLMMHCIPMFILPLAGSLWE